MHTCTYVCMYVRTYVRTYVHTSLLLSTMKGSSLVYILEMYFLLPPSLSPQVILGVTNPFFVKTLEHWPHVIRLAGIGTVDELPSQRSRSPGEGGGDSKPGLHSKYKPFLQRDKNFSKSIGSVKVSSGACELIKHSQLLLSCVCTYVCICRVHQEKDL